jgi:hypothetical protein
MISAPAIELFTGAEKLIAECLTAEPCMRHRTVGDHRQRKRRSPGGEPRFSSR